MLSEPQGKLEALEEENIAILDDANKMRDALEKIATDSNTVAETKLVILRLFEGLNVIKPQVKLF